VGCLLHSIRLTNLLSYGPAGMAVDLQPLNVLIGPNTSGKSNLLDAIGLLRAMPRDFAAAIREGDGIAQWLWSGGDQPPEAEIDATVENTQGDRQPLRHRVTFAGEGPELRVTDEAIENRNPHEGQRQPYFYYRHQRGDPVLNVRDLGGESPRSRRLRREDLNPQQSVLAQRRDPEMYPEVTFVGQQYERIRLFQEWHVGRRAVARRRQDTNLDGSFLAEDSSNLAMVLSAMLHDRPTKALVLDSLRELYPSFEDLLTTVVAGTVQVFVQEAGLRNPLPATRLSDGAMRFLCLLALLCHPSPPPLIGIEEPEIGLHPDALGVVGRLLVEASARCQLIVTTHSPALLSALEPEHVVVCSRDEAGSHLNRLDAEPLAEWLVDYALGDLWAMGRIGGNPT
jgi:predicted ATPase